MGWVYLDDHFPEHPKALDAGGPASWLYVCGLAYANRAAKGGTIPRSAVTRLTDARNGPALAKRLVDVGLWHEDGDRYQIHDYDDWNRSAVERSARARAAAEKRWRKPPPGDAGAMPEHPPGSASGHARAMPEQCEADALAMPSPSPQSPVVSNYVSEDSIRVENGTNRDSVGRANGTTAKSDILLGRLVRVCVARKRDQVQLEALGVIAWAKAHVDDRLIDEAVGYFEQASDPPTFPRAVADVIRLKAEDRGIRMPEFVPLGKALA